MRRKKAYLSLSHHAVHIPVGLQGAVPSNRSIRYSSSRSTKTYRTLMEIAEGVNRISRDESTISADES